MSEPPPASLAALGSVGERHEQGARLDTERVANQRLAGSAAQAVPSYLTARVPTALIFGSFALILLPLLWLVQTQPDSELARSALFVHGVGLGLTHFLITFALYLQSSHLDHFRSSLRNSALYLALPLVIFALFALAAVLGVRESFPRTSALTLGLVRFFDFFHVGRQSFGVLQLYKGADAVETRRAENHFFVLLATTQWLTFAAGGRFDARAPWLVACVGALIGSFVLVCSAHLQRTPARCDRRALAYFVMQALAGALAVYDTRLYLIGLTLHYVEYHVLMAPRLLRAPLDRTRFVDRLFGRLRAQPAALYGLLLALALFVHVASDATGALASLRLVHLFDGLFVAHYAVEAGLWRFRAPFYREQVLPLYRAASEGAPRRALGATLTRPELPSA